MQNKKKTNVFSRQVMLDVWYLIVHAPYPLNINPKKDNPQNK